MKGLLLLLIFLGITYADTIEDIQRRADSLCKISPCRKGTKVVLRVDEKSYYETDLPQSPIIVGNEINLIPGEKYFIELADINNTPTNFKLIDSLKDSSKTLIVEFKQDTSDKKKPSMLLIIHNPFAKILKYDALIHRQGTTRLVYTSSCPMCPKCGAYESWPYPIVRILLSKFRFLEKNSKESTLCK
jgi:hypothetical protein